MSLMTRRILFGVGLALVLLASCVDAHGWMSSPSPRGQYKSPPRTAAEEIAPATTDPSNANFVCRSDPEMPKANWLPLTAGKSQTINLQITALHVGDCFVYLTYDGDKAQNEMKWFKIWEQHACKDSLTYNIPIPDYLPSGDHVIFRWEWYALHIFPTVEYYAQCVDATMSGKAGGVLPLPQVTMPGHLPATTGPMPNNNYWDPFNNQANAWFVGPVVATPNGVPVSSGASSGTPVSTPKPTTAPGNPQATTRPTNPPASTPKPTSPPASTPKPTDAPKPSTSGVSVSTPPPAASQYVKLNPTASSNQWWFSTTVSGHRSNEVTKVEIQDKGNFKEFTPCVNDWGSTWSLNPAEKGPFVFPMTVRVSIASGSSLSFIVNRLPAAASIDSGSVFP